MNLSIQKDFHLDSIFCCSDEEKRKMYHSTSVKNLQQIPKLFSNNDEEQIHDIMSSLLDKIDKEDSNESSIKLFNASALTHRHRVSSETNEDLFQSLDDCKHSSGILVDEKDAQSRKDFIL